MCFFLRGVKETAEQAVNAAKRILELFQQDRKRIEAEKSNAMLLRVFHHAQSRPYMQVTEAARTLKVTYAPIAAALRRLDKLGIIKEVTGKQRNRIFSYPAYLLILSEGTEPIP